MTVDLFVIDRHLVYRKGLISILEDCPEFRVVCDATDSCEAVAKAGGIHPDIVIIDIFMPHGEGVKDIAFLQRRYPGVKVIVLTASDKQDDFFEAIKAGASGYLSKSAALTELIESIRLVANSDTIVWPLKAVRFFTEFREANNATKKCANSLSPRQIEILQLVADGASNKEIAANCYVSETTVKAHLRKVLEKLRVRNRAEAVALAVTTGLLNQSQAHPSIY